jgi:hypothetical protein
MSASTSVRSWSIKDRTSKCGQSTVRSSGSDEIWSKRTGSPFEQTLVWDTNGYKTRSNGLFVRLTQRLGERRPICRTECVSEAEVYCERFCEMQRLDR